MLRLSTKKGFLISEADCLQFTKSRVQSSSCDDFFTFNDSHCKLSSRIRSSFPAAKSAGAREGLEVGNWKTQQYIEVLFFVLLRRHVFFFMHAWAATSSTGTHIYPSIRCKIFQAPREATLCFCQQNLFPSIVQWLTNFFDTTCQGFVFLKCADLGEK